MKIGIIGTGAIAAKHAQAWLNIGCSIRACTNRTEQKGREFASRFHAEFLPDGASVCRHPDVELVDLCTFPDYRLEPVRICAELGKPVQLQKPIATNLADAGRILEVVRESGITAGVVSQHRFDDSSLFLHHALNDGRLGRVLEADCYVKWYRPPSYYSRPVKGSWATEGGGALINQAIHQIDLLRWLAGPVVEVYGRWQLGAVHRIQSEDVVNAILTFANGATGVVQAATAFWPGYPERVEIHGSQGSAIITGDRLTHWDVNPDVNPDFNPDSNPDAAHKGAAPPLAHDIASGASDPMAIPLTPFERQFRDLLEADREHRNPAVSIQDGVNALAIVDAIYASCRTGKATRVDEP